jgi:hypothetical protein
MFTVRALAIAENAMVTVIYADEQGFEGAQQ